MGGWEEEGIRESGVNIVAVNCDGFGDDGGSRKLSVAVVGCFVWCMRGGGGGGGGGGCGGGNW